VVKRLAVVVLMLTACAEPPVVSAPAIGAEEAINAALAAEPRLSEYNITVQRRTTAGELHRAGIATDIPADQSVWHLVFHDPETSRVTFVIVSLGGDVLEVIDGIE
jgi:hypothetical protein